MKIEATKALSNTLQASNLTNDNKKAPSSDFKSVYDRIIKGTLDSNLNIESNFPQIAKIKHQIDGNQPISSKDLLLMQIQIGEINLRLELLSKAADSALSLTRKMQNSQ